MGNTKGDRLTEDWWIAVMIAVVVVTASVVESFCGMGALPRALCALAHFRSVESVLIPLCSPLRPPPPPQNGPLPSAPTPFLCFIAPFDMVYGFLLILFVASFPGWNESCLGQTLPSLWLGFAACGPTAGTLRTCCGHSWHAS